MVEEWEMGSETIDGINGLHERWGGFTKVSRQERKLRLRERQMDPFRAVEIGRIVKRCRAITTIHHPSVHLHTVITVV